MLTGSGSDLQEKTVFGSDSQEKTGSNFDARKTTRILSNFDIIKFTLYFYFDKKDYIIGCSVRQNSLYIFEFKNNPQSLILNIPGQSMSLTLKYLDLLTNMLENVC